MINMYDLTCEFIRTGEGSFKCRYCGQEVFQNTNEYPTIMCNSKMSYFGKDLTSIGIKTVPSDTYEIIRDIPENKENVGDAEVPSMLKKSLNFIKAAGAHALNGSPKCTQQEINERYSVCRACDYFKDNSCTKCGCNLVREKIYMNKLAWADQSCPIGKWQAIKK